jgi:Ca2+-binding RTX toxin-like protein
VFKAGFGHDRIVDFTAAGAKHDVLELDHALFAGFASVQDLLDSTQVVQINHGHGVEIVADTGDTIVLASVSLSELRAHPQDVLFV